MYIVEHISLQCIMCISCISMKWSLSIFLQKKDSHTRELPMVCYSDTCTRYQTSCIICKLFRTWKWKILQLCMISKNRKSKWMSHQEGQLPLPTRNILHSLLTIFPPARSTKPLSSIPPNVLLIQLADSMSGQRKLIPDLTTWMQCFTIYASLQATKLPQYIPEMQAYSRDTMRASRQFKWSSCWSKSDRYVEFSLLKLLYWPMMVIRSRYQEVLPILLQ